MGNEQRAVFPWTPRQPPGAGPELRAIEFDQVVAGEVVPLEPAQAIPTHARPAAGERGVATEQIARIHDLDLVAQAPQTRRPGQARASRTQKRVEFTIAENEDAHGGGACGALRCGRRPRCELRCTLRVRCGVHDEHLGPEQWQNVGMKSSVATLPQGAPQRAAGTPQRALPAHPQRAATASPPQLTFSGLRVLRVFLTEVSASSSSDAAE